MPLHCDPGRAANGVARVRPEWRPHLAAIELSKVGKRFGAVEVIHDLSLQVAAGEFVVFLGPSGCGKSTLLRMVAGLDAVSSGSICIGGRDVTSAPPGERGVAMVFQAYALYPHMTVRDNLAFGLRNVGTPAAEIDRRITEAARMLELEPLLARRPSQLSGGQRQRVAIGRAVVKEPGAFLFDEPLSNLDASLRARTRVELARLHQRLRGTMVFVTHDQVEAMTLATRIVVMNAGRIEQVGAPMDVYTRPATRFVAGFIGSTAMNFLPVARESSIGGLARVRLPDGTALATAIEAPETPRDWTLGVRPEDLTLCDDGPTRGRADVVERLGDRTLVHVALADGSNVVAEAPRDARVQGGDTVALRFDPHAVHLFDAGGQAFHPALSADRA